MLGYFLKKRFLFPVREGRLWHKILLWHFVAFLKLKNATKLPLIFARLCKFDKRLSILDKFIDIINKTEK